MAQLQRQHPPLRLPLVLVLSSSLLLLSSVQRTDTRSSQISDLKSKISGVEELLEEFRKQLQQDQASHRAGDAAAAVIDSCAGDFDAAGERIIRARDSIEKGATFLLAPERVFTWRDCLHACCSQPHCTVAVVQEEPRPEPGDGLSCYLFNCTYRGRHVCSFAPQQGFSTYSRTVNNSQGQGHGVLPAAPSRGSSRRPGEEEATQDGGDEPPRSDAGQDVVIQLPTDWAVLDGRDSVDDYGIGRYEWTPVDGEQAEDVSMLQSGPRKTSEIVVPSQDRTKVAPPQSPSETRTSVSQVTSAAAASPGVDPCAAAPVVGPCKGTFPRWYYDQTAGECQHFLYGGCQGNHNNFLQKSDCVSECVQKSAALNPATVAPPITKQTEIAAPKISQSQTENDDVPVSKPFPAIGGHPVPESAAILPLALGLVITALLLLMIGCRLRLVRHKLKKARPLTTEESDYLINGMYL